MIWLTGGPGIIALFVFSKYLIYLTSHCKSLVYKNVALEILYRMINYVGLKLFQIYLKKMKSKDLQTGTKNKYENGGGRTTIHRDSGGGVPKQTITLRK